MLNSAKFQQKLITTVLALAYFNSIAVIMLKYSSKCKQISLNAAKNARTLGCGKRTDRLQCCQKKTRISTQEASLRNNQQFVNRP